MPTLPEALIEAGAALVSARHAALLRGDATRVHDLRIALRRMRALVQFGKPWIPRAQRAALCTALREFAAPLGRVRDLDVVIRASGHRAGSRPTACLQRQRREAWRLARSSLLAWDAEAFAAQVERIARSRSVRAVDPRRVQERCADLAHKLDRRMRRARRRNLHPIRLMTKRARYVHESLGLPLPADWPAAQRLIGRALDAALVAERLAQTGDPGSERARQDARRRARRARDLCRSGAFSRPSIAAVPVPPSSAARSRRAASRPARTRDSERA